MDVASRVLVLRNGRVAWQGEGVRISEAALARIAFCRQSFLELIDRDPPSGRYQAADLVEKVPA